MRESIQNPKYNWEPQNKCSDQNIFLESCNIKKIYNISKIHIRWSNKVDINNCQSCKIIPKQCDFYRKYLFKKMFKNVKVTCTKSVLEPPNSFWFLIKIYVITYLNYVHYLYNQKSLLALYIWSLIPMENSLFLKQNWYN